MADVPMAIPAKLDQIVFIQLQIGPDMKRDDVMNLKPEFQTTPGTKRILPNPSITQRGPARGAWRCPPNLELADQIAEPTHVNIQTRQRESVES